MAQARAARPARKRPDRYHHGDLRRALLQAALQTIQRDGVAGVTLRAVGEALGVSRTALYRHFASKSALLSAVAAEGFRLLRASLLAAWDGAGRGRDGFAAMGQAYVRFAVANPSHYRVMFGGALECADPDPELEREGAAAFQTLVDAIVAQQRDGLVRPDAPLLLARFVWANVHGIAMLALDGQLPPEPGDVERLTRYAAERLAAAMAPDAG